MRRLEHPRVGSRWYAYGRQTEVVELPVIDGELHVRERDVRTGATFCPTVFECWVRHAVPAELEAPARADPISAAVLEAAASGSREVAVRIGADGLELEAPAPCRSCDASATALHSRRIDCPECGPAPAADALEAWRDTFGGAELVRDGEQASFWLGDVDMPPAATLEELEANAREEVEARAG